MKDSLKVQTHHLKRHAYLYIRQSSMKQVMVNTESTKRQYALRQRANALGWTDDRVIVIDSDQGESGASSSRRHGFQHLVSDVGMGHAGIVMGIEVSRLARNNADWHRLLEICGLTETLILDEDGVYDPREFNDRMLLGLKGTMSEAELHVLKARLRGGILSKVKRGEYKCPLPTGLVYNEAGEVILHPDSQVRETIAYFFETFSRVGSACQTVKMFRQDGVFCPSRMYSFGETRIVYRPLTASAAIRMLHNPRYAGAYAYGRRKYRKTVNGVKVSPIQDINDWTACIPNSHPGYITWEQYQENLSILKNNGRGYETARKSPPREGPALLQGRAVCGKCGRHFWVRYAARRGRNEAWYVCDRAIASNGEPNCQSIAAGPIDDAIGNLVVERVKPAAVEQAIEIRKEIESRQEEAKGLRRQAVDRAQYEADLAQRRFMKVDPENRLVADTLEAEWNGKLRVLAEARRDYEAYLKNHQEIIDDKIQKRLMSLTVDFKNIWNDPETSSRERKRMLACIIEDVTLVRISTDGITRCHVRFRGGRTETLTTENPKSSSDQIKTPPEVVELVDRLLNDYTCADIAEKLNNDGFRPGFSARKGRANDTFTAQKVNYLVQRYNLRMRYERLRDKGYLNAKEMAERLNIHQQTVVSWAKAGILKRHAYNGHYFLYEPPCENTPQKHSSRWNTLEDRVLKMNTTTKSQNTDLGPKEV